jgi:hypothetical protein
MQLGCAAWWSGWTSATIALCRLPAAEEARAQGEKALQVASVPLVALGIGNAIRFIWAGRKHR